MKNMILVASLSLALFVQAAYADNIVSAEDHDAIHDIARSYGSATLKKDSINNNPFITVRIDGTQYDIVFRGCSNGKDCDDILFVAAWRGVKVTMDDINAWNRDKKFGRAFLNINGDPMLGMPVNLDYGVTQRNLVVTFNWWTKVLAGFKKEVLKK